VGAAGRGLESDERRCDRVVDAFEPWRTPNAEALDRRTLASWIEGLNVSALCKAGCTRR
jgi:hypothetical protein